MNYFFLANGSKSGLSYHPFWGWGEGTNDIADEEWFQLGIDRFLNSRGICNRTCLFISIRPAEC